MATWPTKPEWTPPSTLNKGNEYTSQDGVTIVDMNAIIKNLIYLNERGGGGGGGGGGEGSSTTIISNNNTLTILKATVSLAEANAISIGG